MSSAQHSTAQLAPTTKRRGLGLETDDGGGSAAQEGAWLPKEWGRIEMGGLDGRTAEVVERVEPRAEPPLDYYYAACV